MGGQSLCIFRGKLLTSSTDPAPHLWRAGAEKTLDYFLWSKVLFQQLTESSRQVLQYNSLFPAVPHQFFAHFDVYSVTSLFPASLTHPFSATGNQAEDTNKKGQLSPNKLDLQPLFLALTTPWPTPCTSCSPSHCCSSALKDRLHPHSQNKSHVQLVHEKSPENISLFCSLTLPAAKLKKCPPS